MLNLSADRNRLVAGKAILPNVKGLLLCWYFITSRPELKPNRITDDEVKNKSGIELRLPEVLLIANRKMGINSSASIAAN